MEANQKFFPVLDAAGKLTERFIGIANIESKDVAEIRKGYERVIRPRFADAKFFFVEDMKQGLASMNDGLKTVTYQAKLGTVADKVARVAALAEAIAAEVGVDPQQARRAAELSKADLQSRLVNEFPELQGIAGRYYAAVEGEPIEVANAIDEAYMPRFAGDAIAPSQARAGAGDCRAAGHARRRFCRGPEADRQQGSVCVAAQCAGTGAHADRRHASISTCVRSLGLGQAPPLEAIATREVAGRGRRQAPSRDVTRTAGVDRRRSCASCRTSSFDRLRGYYADKGVPAQQFDAVTAQRPVSLLDFDHRLKAIGEFAKLPEAEALAAANKRIRNILRKVEGAIPSTIDPALLTTGAEQRPRRRRRRGHRRHRRRARSNATTSPCSAASPACARRSMRSSTA